MLEKKTISDYVYDKILEGIVQLTYAPGEKISETQLAAALDVSRAPIKSALAKLEKKGSSALNHSTAHSLVRFPWNVPKASVISGKFWKLKRSAKRLSP